MHTSSGNRILLATDVRFWRGMMGSSARISSLISWLLREGYGITVLFIGDLHGDDELQLQENFPTVSVIVANRSCTFSWLDRFSFRNILGSMRLQLHSRTWRASPQPPPTLESYYRPECRRLMEKLVASNDFSHVIIEYVRLAYLLPDKLPSGICSIIDSHDVQSDRWKQFHAQRQFETLAISAAQERKALSRASHILAIQADDAEKLRALGLTSVHVVMHAQPVVELEWHPSGVVLFVGSGMPPNVDAARRLLNDWPQIHESTGRRTELRIVGGVCSALTDIKLSEGVRLLGRLDDLRQAYSDAELVVNPVLYGSGLKIKSVEALCYSRPLLTTAIGAEGLPADSEAYVVTTPELFTQRAIELLNAPARQKCMAQAANRFAHKHFSDAAVFSELARLLESTS